MPKTPELMEQYPISPQTLSRRELLQYGGAIGANSLLGFPETTQAEEIPPGSALVGVFGSGRVIPVEGVRAAVTIGGLKDLQPDVAEVITGTYIKEGGELEVDLDIDNIVKGFWKDHFSPDLLKHSSELEAQATLKESFTEEELRALGHRYNDESEGRSMYGDAHFPYKLAVTKLITDLGSKGVNALKVFGEYMGSIDVKADEDPSKFFQNVIAEKMVLGIGAGGSIQEKRIVPTLYEGRDQLTADERFYHTLTPTQKNRIRDAKIMDQFGPSLRTLYEKRIVFVQDTQDTPDLGRQKIVPKTYDDQGREIQGSGEMVQLAGKWGSHNVAQVHMDYMRSVAADDAMSKFGIALSEPFRVPTDIPGKYVLYAPFERGSISTDDRITDPEWVTQRTRVGAQYIKAMYGADKLPDFPSADPNPEVPVEPSQEIKIGAWERKGNTYFMRPQLNGIFSGEMRGDAPFGQGFGIADFVTEEGATIPFYTSYEENGGKDRFGPPRTQIIYGGDGDYRIYTHRGYGKTYARGNDKLDVVWSNEDWFDKANDQGRLRPDVTAPDYLFKILSANPNFVYRIKEDFRKVVQAEAKRSNKTEGDFLEFVARECRRRNNLPFTLPEITDWTQISKQLGTQTQIEAALRVHGLDISSDTELINDPVAQDAKERINYERAKEGLPLVKIDPIAMKAARAEAVYLAANNWHDNDPNHTDEHAQQDGNQLFTGKYSADRAKRFGAEGGWFGDNLSPRSRPSVVIPSFMDSPGHRALILIGRPNLNPPYMIGYAEASQMGKIPVKSKDGSNIYQPSHASVLVLGTRKL